MKDNIIFIIEDDVHAEWCGEFETFEEAIKELNSRSNLAWDAKPNVCPCKNWKACGREYYLIEFDKSKEPWIEKSQVFALSVSEKGTVWHKDFTEK